MNENTCVMCGVSIPEGSQVCKLCDAMLDKDPDDCEECKLRTGGYSEDV